MGRQYKRQRLSDPPELALHRRREQNDLRLKSTFESIFEKYSKDFNGVGDEIDLETGEIIVNNGHVQTMVNERDAGDLETDSEEDESDNEWPTDEKVLASSLLSETRRRIAALENVHTYEQEECIRQELQSDDEPDSLLGSDDSLIGDAETQSPLPARRAKSRSPDSLYDEDEEDELANTETEWPTPGKAWPTPAKATPLGHTPWHSSPSKPVYKSSISVDPAWRDPSLPTDREPQQRGMPAALTTHRKAKELQRDHYVQRCPVPASGFRTPMQQKPSLQSSLGSMGRLNRRRESDSRENAPLFRSSESMKSPRWTTAEERLLRQLRTTTTLMYKEMKPYFPGRQSRAIMIHWSEMTGNDSQWDRPALLPGHGTSVLSSRRKLSPKTGFYESRADSIRNNRVLDRNMHPTVATIGGGASPALNGYDVAPHHAFSRSRTKQEDVSSHFNLEIPNSSDPTEQSQGTLSSSPAPFARQCGPPLSAPSRRSPRNDIKEEEQEAYIAVTNIPRSDAESACFTKTKVPDNVKKVPHSSPRSSTGASQSTSTKPTSKRTCASRDASSGTPSTGRTSYSRCHQADLSQGLVLPSSCLSDGSDDELSAPIKTVGVHRPESRAAPRLTLSDVVLDRSSSSVSRRS